MSILLHIWHEDNDINSLTKYLFEFLKLHGCNFKLENADIRGFEGCAKLYNFVEYNLLNNLISNDDEYIIMMDNIQDNYVTDRLYKQLHRMISGYSNILLSDILCIEYLLLSFRYFKSWTKPVNKCDKYDLCFKYRDIFFQYLNEGNWVDSKALREYVCNRFKEKSGRKNINEEYIIKHTTLETIACDLLIDLTSFGRFKADKTTFDECWTCDCCIKYIGFNTCNLYNKNMSSCVKARYLYNYTKIKDLIEYFD